MFTWIKTKSCGNYFLKNEIMLDLGIVKIYETIRILKAHWIGWVNFYAFRTE